MTEPDRANLARFHLAAIVESSDDAIIGKTLDGIIQTWNAGARRIFGYTAEEVIGGSVSILIPPGRLDEEAELLQRMGRGERLEHYQTVRMRKDGREIDVSMTVSPIKDDTGRIIGASNIVQDITGRKSFEEAALYLAAIVESSNDAIIGKTPGGIIRSWNAAAERLFGYTRDEVLGRSITLLSPPDRFQEEAGILDRVRRGERVEHYETVRLRKDGTEIQVSLTVSPVKDVDGRIIGASKIARDITEWKRVEKEREQLLAREQQARAEAEAATRAKDEFLATLSHELRTPLNAIVGWARVLETGRQAPHLLERAVETIMRNAKHQAQLIEDLLDISSIVSGRLRLNSRPVDLVAVIAAALETIRPASDAKQVRIERHFDPAVGAVLGDPDRLQQVFWNLLSNAVKFTPKEGRIEVRLERLSSQALVKVIDSGIGIRADVLPFIFERFRQADGSMTRAHGGLGLGLAIVRQLVELHGGTVEVTSPGEGQGATFTVCLPLMPLRAPAAGPGPTRHPDTVRCDGIGVLIVDDEVDGRELLALFLRQCGAQVTAVGSAREALAEIQRVTPGVLISDLAMPGVDGYELIRRVRALPGGARIPAVALTAHAGAGARADAFLAGFDTYVAKPVDPAELAAVVIRLGRRTEGGSAGG